VVRATELGLLAAQDFRITERQSLRFTTDFFNLWNHANSAIPPSQTSKASDSEQSIRKIASSLGTPRLIQFSCEYAF